MSASTALICRTSQLTAWTDPLNLGWDVYVPFAQLRIGTNSPKPDPALTSGAQVPRNDAVTFGPQVCSETNTQTRIVTEG